MIAKNPRDGENDILAPESPLVIAFLGESEVVDFLKIAGLSTDDARSIKKSIIRYRNDKIAHAKGYIEQDVETKLMEYFDWLEKSQTAYLSMNREVAVRWIEEIEASDNMEQFLEIHFLDSCFSAYDFGNVVGILLEAEQIDFDQWGQVVNKGLELAYDQTISALINFLKNGTDKGKRFNAIRVLHENGEIDEEMKKSIIENNKDEEILELFEK